MIIEEIWKDVIGYEGLYKISNLGRAKRIYKNKPEKILKPIKGSYGYMHYSFCKNSKTQSFRIHRLVALYFIDNPSNYPEVNHIDGNKENYSIENLEWCTRSQNMKHGHSLGLIFTNKASEAVKIITEEKLIIIKKMKNLGFTLKEMSCISGVTISTIHSRLNSLENII